MRKKIYSSSTGLFSTRGRFGRLFDEFFREGFRDVEARLNQRWSPAVDVSETEDTLLIRAEIAGVSKDDIELSVDEDTLILRGERKQAPEVRAQNYHRIERPYGPFQRIISLPSSADIEKISADFKDGVLEVRIAKKEAAKPRKIEVQQG